MEEQRSTPDLTGLQPSYQTPAGRGVRWVFIALFGANALSAVLRLTNDPDGFDIVLSVLMLGFYGYALAYFVIRPPAVFVEPAGLRFRRFVRLGPPLPWSEVREVEVQGRWEDHSSILTQDGRTLRLTGMPAEDAQHLADALARTRS